MIQDSLGYLKADAKPLKAGCERPSKIVQPPGLHRFSSVFRYQPVELLLSFVVASKAAAS